MTLASVLKSITAADANRRFSELLRDVREGSSVIVTVHGKPVAKIVPVDERAGVVDEGRQALFARLGRQRVVRAGAWTRESLYSDES